jgi:Rrf2 family nitric oxide-sensitive transcriptional repressor
MYLAAADRETWIATADVARAFGISQHHLQKAAQGLVHAGYIEAMKGRAGGVRLAVDPGTVRLGAVVAGLEGIGCLVECQRGPCPLAGRCVLKTVLDGAERVFIRELDRFTLADAIAGDTHRALLSIMGAGHGA